MRVVLAVLLLLVCAGGVVYLLEDAGHEPTASDDVLSADDASVRLTAAGTQPVPRALTTEDEAGRALLADLQGLTAEDQLALLSAGKRRLTGFHAGLARHLAGLLDSGTVKLRIHAAGRLMHMGAQAAPFIMPLLAHEEDAVRSQALYLLYHWRARGDEIPVLDFMALLDDPAAGISNLALNILGMGAPYDPEVAARLRAITLSDTPIADRNKPLPEGYSSSGSVGTPFLASDALANMGPRGIAILQALLSSEDPVLRGMLLRSLAKAPAEHLEPLLPDLSRLLRDEDGGVRSSALLVLDALDGRCLSCLPELLVLVEDEGGPLDQVIHVLAEIGPKAEAAVPPLIEYLKSPDEHLVDRAAGALGAIRSRPAETLGALESLVVEEGNEAAAKAMAAFGRAGYEYALQIFRGDDPDARHAALLVFALQGEAAAGVVPELLPVLRGEDVFLRERAALTIAAIGPAAAIAAPVLVEVMLRPNDPLPPSLAGMALHALGPRGESALKRALQAKELERQRRALRALQRFRGRMTFALDEIEPWIGSKEYELRYLVLEALLAGLHYPEGFLQTPPGNDDARLRALTRKALQGALAEPVVHDEWLRKEQLRMLDAAGDG